MYPDYKRSCWSKFAEMTCPIFIYGTGNGADKIIDILELTGTRIEGVFASDGFVRSRMFRGHKVLSYSDVRSRYGDNICVIAAFGSNVPDVLDFLEMLDLRHDLYIPEVPLFCDDLTGELFTDEYFASHRDEISATRALLSDEESVMLFDDMINHRLTAKLEYLMRTEDPRDSIRGLLPTDAVRHAIDGGAFKGDTAELFCEEFSNLSALAAIEPDERSYKKLCALAKEKSLESVIPVNAALSDAVGVTVIVSGGSRGSAVGGNAHRSKTLSCNTVTIDRITEETLSGKCDFIKLDTEGFELAALTGAKSTLALRPILSVSLYHRTSDLFVLPLLICKNYPCAKYYLRRPRCVPEWDLTLYVVPEVR